jgi:hypothetical protein
MFSFVKQSGEFFGMKLFNLFTMPVGFDSIEIYCENHDACEMLLLELSGPHCYARCHQVTIPECLLEVCHTNVTQVNNSPAPFEEE